MHLTPHNIITAYYPTGVSTAKKTAKKTPRTEEIFIVLGNFLSEKTYLCKVEHSEMIWLWLRIKL